MKTTITLLFALALCLSCGVEHKIVHAQDIGPKFEVVGVRPAGTVLVSENFRDAAITIWQDGKTLATVDKKSGIQYVNGADPEQVIRALIKGIDQESDEYMKMLKQDEKQRDECIQGFQQALDAYKQLRMLMKSPVKPL